MKRTIRDVKIGDKYVGYQGDERRVVDVGRNGFANDEFDYFTFENAEQEGFIIKQPEQGIEIANELVGIGKNVLDLAIIENRRLIIKLQKIVNNLKKG